MNAFILTKRFNLDIDVKQFNGSEMKQIKQQKSNVVFN